MEGIQGLLPGIYTHEEDDKISLYYYNGANFELISAGNGEGGISGKDGRGINSITKTATNGLVDTYTITYTDKTTSTFTVTNGTNGIQGESALVYNEVIVTSNAPHTSTSYFLPIANFNRTPVAGETFIAVFSSTTTNLTYLALMEAKGISMENYRCLPKYSYVLSGSQGADGNGIVGSITFNNVAEQPNIGDTFNDQYTDIPAKVGDYIIVQIYAGIGSNPMRFMLAQITTVTQQVSTYVLSGTYTAFLTGEKGADSTDGSSTEYNQLRVDYEAVQELGYDDDTIYWDTILKMEDEDSEEVDRKPINIQLPIIAGNGIEFKPNQDGSRMTINATGSGSADLYRHEVSFHGFTPDDRELYFIITIYNSIAEAMTKKEIADLLFNNDEYYATSGYYIADQQNYTVTRASIYETAYEYEVWFDAHTPQNRLEDVQFATQATINDVCTYVGTTGGSGLPLYRHTIEVYESANDYYEIYIQIISTSSEAVDTEEKLKAILGTSGDCCICTGMFVSDTGDVKEASTISYFEDGSRLCIWDDHNIRGTSRDLFSSEYHLRISDTVTAIDNASAAVTTLYRHDVRLYDSGNDSFDIYVSILSATATEYNTLDTVKTAAGIEKPMMASGTYNKSQMAAVNSIVFGTTGLRLNYTVDTDDIWYYSDISDSISITDTVRPLASITVNGSGGIDFSEIGYIDTWVGTPSGVDYGGVDGIYWDEEASISDENGNSLWRGEIAHRIPIMAGNGITFEPTTVDGQTGNNVVKINAANSQIAITYSELKELRDNKQLVPGVQYRITDYQCTTTQEGTKSAEHQFDIIVTADSENVLNEKARACLHKDGDNVLSFDPSVLADDDGNLIEGAVVPYYYIFEDFYEGTEDTHEDYKSDDQFFWYDYRENGDGEVVPVLYKTDTRGWADNPDEFGYADTEDSFFYEGTIEIDGVVYDKWRKICENQDTGPHWDASNGKIWALTNVIVNGSIDTYFNTSKLEAWELKYCLDNDTARFAWANAGQTIVNLQSNYSNGAPLKRQPDLDGLNGANGASEYQYA